MFKLAICLAIRLFWKSTVKNQRLLFRKHVGEMCFFLRTNILSINKIPQIKITKRKEHNECFPLLFGCKSIVKTTCVLGFIEFLDLIINKMRILCDYSHVILCGYHIVTWKGWTIFSFWCICVQSLYRSNFPSLYTLLGTDLTNVENFICK